MVFAFAAAVAAEVGPKDREDILRLAKARGRSAADAEALVEEVDRASARGLPQPPLVNKLKEGLAKGIPPARVQAVLRDLAGRLDRARELLGESRDASGSSRAIEVLADALGRGLTAEDVREIERQLRGGGSRPDTEILAFGAKSWALMREAGVDPQDGLSLLVEAVRQGYRAMDLLTLARELGRHRAELSRGQMNLEAVRESIRRGDPPERLFPTRDDRERPDRIPPERPTRVRPERPDTR